MKSRLWFYRFRGGMALGPLRSETPISETEVRKQIKQTWGSRPYEVWATSEESIAIVGRCSAD